MNPGAVTAPSISNTGTARASAAEGAASGGLSFRQFLSDINPLQYIPVVGAVYRAATGDDGNASLRFVASLGTSFALGGPLGLGITVAEKITGIDPERIARSLLGKLLHHGSTTAAVAGPGAAADSNAAAPFPTGTQPAADAASRPWSAAELAAYAASTSATLGNSGTARGDTGAGTGSAVTADMLNGMELQRVATLYA